MKHSVKRFVAQSAREALRRVKEDFGGDAIILSNRSVDGGVEIMAVPAAAMAALQAGAESGPAHAATFAPRITSDPDFTVSLSGRPQRASRHWQALQAERIAASAKPAPAAAAQPARSDREAPAPARPSTPRTEHDPAAPALLEELKTIRSMIERQLAGFAFGDLARRAPASSALLGELVEAGFSGELARRLVEAVPADADPVVARNLVSTALGRSLLTAGSDADIIDRGGVYALVGPTGVGKTTTTAKLAARCVVRHGADRLALLTTDGYRIGAFEQLRIYGRILGVAVHAVRDAAELRRVLGELAGKHMILIDTVGMSQRDRQVAEQAAMLMNGGDVRRLLLLNATARGDVLDEVVAAYSGPDLAGCILTKVDEAASLAPALDALVRNELELFYVANGQRVPEDMHLPNRAYLLHRALKSLPEDSAHRLCGEEAAFAFAVPRAAAIAQGAPLV
ncbi:MAG TPA: flagellar biosynthesis protein FlhF [Rhodocyclaceae bacterium]|nr:MAG: flagellar biosynthesis protein FlhF [Betaproteobacteria bacterium CG2_30_68_42]PIX75081.1 MAG: flagellar biosynthesis protein FlhF [Rhodocyclales bacterium CG_4_10_14_3_um_filter_68_10]PJA57956.1 MAG: flagellar biosynthesis protein FlhF [Rhodocyclales bacterium CG_4_9_14_3_um_filter_68_10]HCX34772.1 flagellar biosynthesis protein FlhF [Rhodocyclaceae bacterium]